MCLQLDTEKLEKIPILKKLRALEEQVGKDVTLGAAPAPPAEPGLHTSRAEKQSRRRPRQSRQQDAEGMSSQEKRAEAAQKGRLRRGSPGGGRRGEDGDTSEQGKGKDGGDKTDERGSEVTSQRRLPVSVTTVYLGGIPAGLRVSELKAALREREAAPLRLTWQGAQHRAFLDYSHPQAAQQALLALQGLSLHGHSLQAELAKSQRGGKKSGQLNRKPGASAALKPKTAAEDTKADTAGD